ncbi:MAG: hypothetical protein UU69_C0014G0015 [Candidatus Magasanikbacteria bacterium GW2011_GWA2_41_55]|uniref:Uncharacterized protein n=1 Tax=Candidatus Magasanikbacteria bacterium GW2011_GWA2_41_55 TaxID=1619038 RepID=A0A0G0YTV0_9BACT|nr:MAG: hypothetical protein UU69_C0014G0015 [Candidatus Magasanikbacteria bacterium GW2011_GWA2_41_55]
MTEGEPKILDGLTDERRKLIDAHFTSGVGLYRDVINIWTPLPMVLDGDSIDGAFLVDLKPLPHYAEYLDARQYTPSEIKKIKKFVSRAEALFKKSIPDDL